jgi:hypothetical protein
MSNANGVDDNNTDELSQMFSLLQNYPNRFSLSTVTKYSLSENNYVSLIVHNLLRQNVAELVKGEFGAGYHQVVFDRTKISNGMYFNRLTAGEFIQINKMLLMN